MNEVTSRLQCAGPELIRAPSVWVDCVSTERRGQTDRVKCRLNQCLPYSCAVWMGSKETDSHPEDSSSDEDDYDDDGDDDDDDIDQENHSLSRRKREVAEGESATHGSSEHFNTPLTLNNKKKTVSSEGYVFRLTFPEYRTLCRR
uniref:Uncharacterized protein n=1 Tax=Timema shepardi TaxID=629360 RepID=A0A7R9FW13_TIMSH|nr:unnamed protein product [Timema shepardi]